MADAVGLTRVCEVRGLELAYVEYGDPAGPPLLCLHGFLDHGASFRFMAEHLRGVRVIAPDMRGHGRSGWVGSGGYYHFYDYYDDCRRLLDHLGWRSGALLGHSMGGSVATGLAALEPDRFDALVLLEGMGPPYVDLGRTVDRLRLWSDELRRPPNAGPPEARRAARKTMAGLEDAADRLQRLNPRLPRHRAEALAETLCEPQGGGVVWRHDPLHRTPAAKPFVRQEAEALWRGVRAPVLSLLGEHSWFRLADLPAREGMLSSVARVTIPGAGHNIHHDQPERLAAVVQAWLAAPGRAPPHDIAGSPTNDHPSRG